MFTNMDKIDDNKIMMNTMNYHPNIIEEDDEEIDPTTAIGKR